MEFYEKGGVARVSFSYTAKLGPTAVNAGPDQSVCSGAIVHLTGFDDGLITPLYSWTGGIVVSGGNTLNPLVNPITTRSYTLNATLNGCTVSDAVIGDGCPGSATGSALVTLPTKGASLASDGESAICLVNAGEIVHFYHESGRFITTVQASGTSLGYTTATVFVDPVAFVVPACGQPSNPHYFTATLGRRWVIEPTDQGAAIVTLSFDGKEYESLQNAAAATSSNCGQGVTNLYSNSGNGNLSASFPGFDVNARFLNYAVPGFSEFWLHGATISPLPVTLTSLSATCDETVMLSWTTASEQNSDRFVIEKSRDGKSWFYVGAQAAAGNSNRVINYTQSDHDSWIGMNYYRLRQVDFNEEQTIFGPISVSCERNESSIEVFPNPNNGSFTVNISSNHKQSEAFLYLTDMSGKIIHYQKVDVGVGTKQIIFDNLEIQNGTYFLTLQTSNKDLKPVKIVVI